MKSSSQWRGTVLRRFAGWSALLLYLAAFSPLGIGLATALGSLDCDHRVDLRAGDGGLRLVLHHQTRCQPHHHGLVARALTTFTRPASPGEPDHVLQFNAADNLTGSARLKCALESAPASLPPAMNEPAVALRSLSPLASSPHAPPPGDTNGRRCLRSTLLLI